MNTTETLISVLIVDSSLATRVLLCKVFSEHPRLSLAGDVGSGEAALTWLETGKPDIVLMDMLLPGMDGFATTRRIMETSPVPIVICSDNSNPGSLSSSFDALKAGALAVVEKPLRRESADFSEQVDRLVTTLLLMSEIKVVKRWPGFAATSENVNGSGLRRPGGGAGSGVIGIGASTGGPPVLHTILKRLPKTAPPVLIVQHISSGFLPAFINWLQEACGVPCRIAENNEIVMPGTVYFAPDEHHLMLGVNRTVRVCTSPPENGLRPSVDVLFRSMAENCAGQGVGILLTGMGKDGAAELKKLRARGTVTIVQSPKSCVVSGMPGEAIRLEAACKVLSPEEIGEFLAGRYG